jgi:hypothetical protein
MKNPHPPHPRNNSLEEEREKKFQSLTIKNPF